MLRKLIKHELKGTYRRFAQMFIGLIGIAVATKIFTSINSGNVILEFITSILACAYILCFFVAFVCCVAYNVDRFYKNLTKDQGYLSLTLPVTVSQHIISKSIVAVVWTILTNVCVVLIAGIGFWGDGFEKVPGYIAETISDISKHGIWGLTMEAVIVFILSMLFYTLLFYESIALGQLVKNHRTLGSVLAFCANIVVLMSALMGVANIIDFVLGNRLEKLTEIQTSAILLHIFLFGMLIFSVIYFIITKYIFERKFDIE